MNPWTEAQRKLDIAIQHPGFNKFSNQFPVYVSEYIDYKMYELMQKAHIMQALGIPLNLLGNNRMAKQTILVPSQVEHTKQAAYHLKRAFPWMDTPDGDSYWRSVYDKLEHMTEYGTTDGNPFKSQVELSPGYRWASSADCMRSDRQIWAEGIWIPAGTVVTMGGRRYQVPVDRIPTDEDAKGRPTVMVRDYDTSPWQVQTLLKVYNGKKFSFLCVNSAGHECYSQCRFPYPGEV